MDGPDLRHAGLAPDLSRWATTRWPGAAAARQPARSLDEFSDPPPTTSPTLHPSRYGRLVDGSAIVHLTGVLPPADQSSGPALGGAHRPVIRPVDPGARLRRAAGRDVHPQMMSGGYRKKYLRATSRLLALAARNAALILDLMMALAACRARG